MTGWLRCKLTSGMFSDEVAVTYPDLDRWQKSVFVPRTFVRYMADQPFGQVQVDVVNNEGERFAVLPSARRDIVRIEEAEHLVQR